jgi:ABC-type Fe3+/spermidine/putrescine transport system ATPase subunit
LTVLAADDGGYRAGAEVTIGIRSERMSLHGPGSTSPGAAADPTANRFPGTLDDELYLGDRTDWRVALGQETVTVAEGAGGAHARQRGQPVTVAFPAAAVLRLEDA